MVEGLTVFTDTARLPPLSQRCRITVVRVLEAHQCIFVIVDYLVPLDLGTWIFEFDHVATSVRSVPLMLLS
jgi:hypothetical protein